MSAIRSLIFRAKKLNSSVENYEQSFIQIKNNFIPNGYSDQIINKIRREIDNRVSNVPSEKSERNSVILKLPYLKSKEGQTVKSVQAINKILPKDVRLLPIYRTLTTRDVFPNKDKVPTGLSSNVIYKFQCEQCSCCYIGETRRHLSTRVREHITDSPIPTEITKHVHIARVDNFSVLRRTPYTKIAETLAIKDNSCTLLNEHSTSITLRIFAT